MNQFPEWLQITFKGRLNRFRYFWFSVFAGLILQTVHYCLLGIFYLFSPETSFLKFILQLSLKSLEFNWDFYFFPIVIGFVFQIVYSLYFLSLVIRRLHDLNRTGWWTLLFSVQLLPFFFSPVYLINSTMFWILIWFVFIFSIYTLFFKGTVGPNKYGLDPLEYARYSDYLQALDVPNVQAANH